MSDTPGFVTWLEEHPALSLAVGALAVFLLARSFMNKNKDAGTATPGANLSGLATDAAGNHIVYIPTSTNFTTENIGAYSNDPNLQTVTGSPADNTTSTTNVTKTITVNDRPIPIVLPVTPTGGTPPPKPTPPPVHTPPPTRMPPPAPAPSNHKGGRVWDQRYSVKKGDTLSGIAAGVQNYMRRYQGMPGSVGVSTQDLYSHNKAVIDSAAQKHGYPISPNPRDNIFYGGEVLITPRWDKNLN